MRQAIGRALELLTRRDRRLLAISIAIQMATSLLDLVGVLLIGMVAALAVTTVQSQPPPEVVDNVASTLGLQNLTSQGLVVAFAVTAAVVLLAKSIFSSYLTRRVLVFLANRQALVAARLTKELLSRPLTFVQARSSQETAYALISGSGAATNQILGQVVVAATEAALLGVLAAALFIFDPLIALASLVFFGLVAVVLQRAMGNWAARVGSITAQADIASLNAVQEALSAYREITVTDRRLLYVDRIQDLRWQAAKVMADTQFIAMFPKYMFEAALVLGGFLLAGYLFTTENSVAAVGTLALFLAAGTRIMPSLLRFQGATLTLRGAAGAAGPTFDLADELSHPMDAPEHPADALTIKERIQDGWGDFSPTVTVDGVSVRYPGARNFAITDVSLSIPAGGSLALIGRSGAGKSTLVDLLLGILEPQVGSVRIGGLPPDKACERWPGGISYVPQDVALATGTVRQNVALGLPEGAIDDERVWEALDRAHIGHTFRESADGLATEIGERGVRLSGGQRQRLGIARALYTRPRLLVLDEATSALDAETERAITQTIEELEGQVTTVVVAHRLSTVRSADRLVYLDDGRAIAQGDFDYLLTQLPDFMQQAKLMGLA